MDYEETEIEAGNLEGDLDTSDQATPSDPDFEVMVGDQAILGEDRPTPCTFITGPAGCGKTHSVRAKVEVDPKYAILAATTGIAAVNIGSTTIHSLIGYYKTADLKDAYYSGKAAYTLQRLMSEGYQNVAVDEVSMLQDEQLDLLVNTFDDVNRNRAAGKKPLGLILLGDMCQLAPIAEDEREHVPGQKLPPRPRGSVRVPWCFEAGSWSRFEANTIRLTTNWRQADPRFLQALNAARAGRGGDAASLLAAVGVRFEGRVLDPYDGTTIVATNREAERINSQALARVRGREILLPSRRWGNQRNEWSNIPKETMVKENAYVMLLSNRKLDHVNFEYVNGECGHVMGLQPSSPGSPPAILVQLVRNGEIVAVHPLVRHAEHRLKPDEFRDDLEDASTEYKDETGPCKSKRNYLVIPNDEDMGDYIPEWHYRGRARRYIKGQVQHYPINLAYASTCHKTQGLTLDRVQVDVRHWMWKNPAMLYVSMSRCRTPQGLRLVGTRELVADRCKCDPKVVRWL